MSLVLPQIVIDDFLRKCIDLLRADCVNNQVENTIIYSLFGDCSRYRYNYTTQAIELFRRDNSSSRYIDVRLAFDRERAKIPTIHVTIPSDNEFSQGIGNHEGFRETIVTEYGRMAQPTYTRFFDGRVTVMFTSDNEREVIMMYEVIRAMSLAASDHFELSGLQKLSFAGQDISLHPELVPPHIYMKALSFACIYEVNVGALRNSPIITKLFIDINNQTCNCDD